MLSGFRAPHQTTHKYAQGPPCEYRIQVIIRRIAPYLGYQSHMAFSIIQCDSTGNPVVAVDSMPQTLIDNCLASVELYKRVGFHAPWVSYVALNDGVAVGGGAFVGAPRDGVVEIAYFTLPEHEGRGFASSTATQLCLVARSALPGVIISAYTLPEQNASTRILTKLGFQHVGMATDEDAGEVWEWRA